MSGYLPSTAAHTQRLLPQISQNSKRSLNALTNQDQDSKSSNKTHGSPLLDGGARHAKLKASIQTLQAQIANQKIKLGENVTNIRNLDSTISTQQNDGDNDDERVIKHAAQTVSKHIKLLHRYNEVKDIGLGLLGLIADKEGKRLGEVMDERGVDDKD